MKKQFRLPPLLAALAAPLALAAAQAAPEASAAAPAAAASASDARVQVDAFVVTGNTLLPPAVLDAALAPYKGQRTLDELKAAAAAVQARYVAAGWGGVVAYVPVQHEAPGVVAIAVVEGRISRVVVLGKQRDGEAQVRRSVSRLEVGATPEPRRIDAQIALANQNPARQTAVTLEPGAQPGEIEAHVTVTEQPERHWSFGVDNTGTSQTGRLRANLGLEQAGLNGFGGQDNTLELQAQIAPEKPGSVAVVSADWRAPLYRAGLMADFIAAYSDVDGGTTSTAAGPLQFSGKGHVFGVHLGGALPRVGELSQRLTGAIDYRAYLNSCAIVGLPAGACGSAGASVSVSPWSIEYALQLGGANPLALQISFASNAGVFGPHGNAADFGAVRPGAPVAYTVVRANGLAQIALPAHWQIQLRGAAQSSADALVPGEQFGLGGANAVRGYEEREVTGDQALLGSGELRGPDLGPLGAGVWFGARGLEHLQLLAFGDAGRVWNHLGAACLGSEVQCTLASAGLGARLAGRAGAGGWQLRLDLAEALKAGTLTARHSRFLHAQAVYEFN
ncbi:MAG: ShlB/FhaC/HecB family hemolysin secretion/activation protein [Pelomonas sp.]|nr:ShlB/FhaC/HecB family hemolysin secretion/activation protein [Roseateles sp.]